MRFFAGEIIEDTVKAVAVGPEQPLVDMAAAPEAEHEVSMPAGSTCNAQMTIVWSFSSE